MPLLEIINDDFQLTWTPLKAAVPNPAGAVITKYPVTGVNENSKPILEDKLTWTISGCPAGVVKAHGGGSILATATACTCKENMKKPLRKTDQGLCNGTYFFYVVFACQCQVQITDAGQTGVKGE